MTERTNVLVIASSPVAASQFETMLKKQSQWEFAVWTAADIDRALSDMPDVQFDLVVLDLDRTDGLEYLQVLRERCELPILFLSDDENLAKESSRSGTDDYLIKRDLSSRWLQQTVVHVAERHRLRSRLALAQEELAQAQVHADEATKIKSAFFADVSHEIRTPMNAMIGITDLLRRSPLNREQRKFVEIIQHAGRTLTEVIDDLLTLSKMEAGKFGLTHQVFDLRHLVESAAEMLADRAREKDIYLTTFVGMDLPGLVIGDSQRLRQVILNLAANAIRATELSKIEIRVGLVGRKGDDVELKIEIAEKNATPSIKKVDGSRLSSANTSAQAGGSESSSGLGLEISKRIIEKMGGTVIAEEKAQGCAFFITAHLTVAPANNAHMFDPKELKGRRLLLGNLQSMDYEVICEYAHALGIEYDIALSSRSIVEHIDALNRKGERYHLVIIDLMSSADSNSGRADLLGDLAQKNIDLAIIKPVEEIGIVNLVFELQIAHQLNKPLKQSQFIACLTSTIQYQDDTEQVEREMQFEDDLLKTANFDLTQRVMVVEDNQVNREVARLQLKNLGLKPVLVSGGMQALEELSRNHYEFILMDCMMPKLDGYETTRRIRKMQEGTGLRSVIIALTANAMIDDREKCIEAGMDDFLSKPVTIEKLGHTLVQWQSQVRKVAQPSSTSGKQTSLEALEAEQLLSEEDGHSEEEDDSAEKESGNNLDLALIKSHLISTYGDGPGTNIFDLFCSSTPNLIAQIESAWDIKDWAALARTVHELKGQCSMVQANKLAALCKELERIIKSQEQAAVENLLKKLRDSYEKAKVNEQTR